MAPDQLIETTKRIISALFDPSITEARQGGTRYFFRSFGSGDCRGVDVGLYRFITQNPNKKSKWAKLAREGAQVGWVVHDTEGWLARYVNGEIELLTS